MSQVSASEHGPVCSRRGYADRGLVTLFNAHMHTERCAYVRERARSQIPPNFRAGNFNDRLIKCATLILLRSPKLATLIFFLIATTWKKILPAYSKISVAIANYILIVAIRPAKNLAKIIISCCSSKEKLCCSIK